MHKMIPKFSNKDPKKFFKILNKRVNNYFSENNIKRTGNWRLYLKSLIIFGIFMLPYFIIMFFDLNQWIALRLIIITGIGMAGVGMNIMHDGNHGVFSSKR